MSDDSRKYRINVVARLTGVSPATLRAWERRYGLPVPARTDSSYRVYTEDDVQTVRRLKSLCEQGMSPSEAAKLILSELDQEPEPAANGGDPYRPSQEAILQAVEKFDPVALEAAVQHSLALGSASTIYDRVIRAVMVEVGERWHRGDITIGQEHLVTQVLENAARRLLGLVQPSGAARQIVLAGFAGDEHTLPLYGVALHLASAGFRIVMLGGRTPASAIRQAVVELEPACIGLSVTVAPPAHEARALVDSYADACAETPWLVGGAGAESLRTFIEARGGAIAPKDDARFLLRAVEQVIAKSRRRSSTKGAGT